MDRGRLGGDLRRCVVGIGGERVVSDAPCHCDLCGACLCEVRCVWCRCAAGPGEWRVVFWALRCRVKWCHVVSCPVVSRRVTSSHFVDKSP